MNGTDATTDITNKVLDGKLDRMLVNQHETNKCLSQIKTEQARQDERIKKNAENVEKNGGEIKTLRSTSNRLDVVVVAVGAAIAGVTGYFGGK